MLYSCSGSLIASDQSLHEVKFLVSQEGLSIHMTNTNAQIAFLPKGSMDSILTWFRYVNEADGSGSLDLDNLEKQIKVTFQLKLQDLIKLEQLLRGRLVYFRKPLFKILGELAPQIYLLKIEGTNTTLIEKVAFFPKDPRDKYNLSRLDQVRQEFMILNQLRSHPHPNIISLEEVSTNGISLSVIMEHCIGGDLLKFLNDKNALPNVKQILQNLLKGIQHLHSLDILHRDLKLQNVFLKNPNDFDSVVIADFGLSCHKSQIQFYNPRCGTPGYTAPEVFDQNSIYDEKVDIFSLGVMFFNMLTMKNPFGTSKNPQDLIKKNILADYEHSFLEPIKTQHPKAYDLVTKMLLKDSKLRPSATQCLNHSYFSEASSGSKEDSTFDLIQNYQNNEHQQIKVFRPKQHQMTSLK